MESGSAVHWWVGIGRGVLEREEGRREVRDVMANYISVLEIAFSF